LVSSFSTSSREREGNRDWREARRSSKGEEVRKGASKTYYAPDRDSITKQKGRSRELVEAYHVLEFTPTRRMKRTNDSRSFVETVPSDVELSIEGTTARKFCDMSKMIRDAYIRC